MQAVFNNFIETSKPVITVVNGPAIGGGCELAALGDILIATPKARFSQPEVKLGVFPPLAAVILPHVIGHKRALEMIFTGEPLSAQEAQRLGLVSRVIPEEKLAAELKTILTKITDQSAPVLEMAKRVLYDTIGVPLPAAMKKSGGYLSESVDGSRGRAGRVAGGDREAQAGVAGPIETGQAGPSSGNTIQMSSSLGSQTRG